VVAHEAAQAARADGGEGGGAHCRFPRPHGSNRTPCDSIHARTSGGKRRPTHAGTAGVRVASPVFKSIPATASTRSRSHQPPLRWRGRSSRPLPHPQILRPLRRVRPLPVAQAAFDQPGWLGSKLLHEDGRASGATLPGDPAHPPHVARPRPGAAIATHDHP
jgi:hypothetical protein